MSSVLHKVDFIAALCTDLLQFNRIWSFVYWNAAVHTADEGKQSAGLESFVNEKGIFRARN